MLLDGKVALVSGAGAGLGRAAGRRLAAHGARVVFSDLDEAAVTASVRAVHEDGGEAHGVEVIQPSFGAYTGSKAALAHHTKLLAAELGGDGIRVNAVYPGPIWGPNLQGFLDAQAGAANVEPEVVYAAFRAKNAMNEFVTADAVADCIVFLASDLSRTLTGQALYANAGESFH